MKNLILVVLIICQSALSLADDKVIKLAIYSEGDFPPYTFKDGSAGIIIDVLKPIASKYGYRVRQDNIPRKRVERKMKEGDVDAVPIAKEWATNPNDFEFTDPIVEARDVLFYLIETPLQFNEFSDLFGKTLGTHLGYVYPTLEEYFRANKITRSDAPTELSMLKMALNKRVDAAVVNEVVGLWLIKQNSWQGKLKIATKAIDSVGYPIMFSRKWKPFVKKFNQELRLMKQNGSLEKILAKYR